MGTMNIDGWDIDLCERGLVALYVDVPVGELDGVQLKAADGVQAIRLLKRELERLRAERWHQARHAVLAECLSTALARIGFGKWKDDETAEEAAARMSAEVADACHGKLP